MITVIIDQKLIQDFEVFTTAGQVNQHIKPNDVFYYVTNFDKQIKEIHEDFSSGTYYLCEVDVPFNYPQDQKLCVDKFLNEVLCSSDIECTLCIRKIFAIVI